MVTLSGVAHRPPGSDRYGPAVGEAVAWRLAQPVADLARQAELAAWPVLGTIGNEAHLRKHGDHTPWSGKKRGVVYAIDVDAPDAFESWFRAMCASTYDTTWVDFWNFNGSQYDNTGKRVDDSPDEHLHISAAKGAEDRRVSLFADYAMAKAAAKKKPKETPMDRSEDIFRLLHDGKRPGPESSQTHSGGIPSAWIVLRFWELEKKLDTIIERLGSLVPPA